MGTTRAANFRPYKGRLVPLALLALFLVTQTGADESLGQKLAISNRNKTHRLLAPQTTTTTTASAPSVMPVMSEVAAPAASTAMQGDAGKASAELEHHTTTHSLAEPQAETTVATLARITPITSRLPHSESTEFTAPRLETGQPPARRTDSHAHLSQGPSLSNTTADEQQIQPTVSSYVDEVSTSEPSLSRDPFFRWSINSNNDEFDDFLLEPTITPPSTSQTSNDNSNANNKSTLFDKQSNQGSSNNYSDAHPLLIYSIRYELRSYDLFSTQQAIRSQHSAPSNTHPPGSSYYATSYEPHASSGRASKTLIAGLKNTIGLDFYYSENESYIFWTDVIEERIYKGTFINGTITNVDPLIQTGLATAEGLAVDWIGLNLYWVESTLDHIEVARINGSSRRTLIAGDMESPRAIAVDPRYGLLFWTDWDKRSPRIERATMSGEDRKTLVYIKEVDGGWPNGLTLDYQNLKIYWIDANSDSIHAVDYNGDNHQPLLRHSKSLGHPFSITLFDNNLYWTDWKTNSVSTANKKNGSDARELQRLTSRLFDIKVFHSSRQPKIDNSLNPCYLDNGNCSHLCLLSLNHTRKCECPPLMKLAQDNKTCESDERVLLIGKTSEIRVVDITEPLHHVMAPISVPKVFSPRQFEYHAKSRTIFWADSQNNEVKRAQLVGNDIETVMDAIIESPSGLALDWISENIYVTSAAQHKTPGKILISNLNGEYISVLMDGAQGIVNPSSLAVHPALGLLFCIDESLDSNLEFPEPIIFVASMDGGNKRIIVNKFHDAYFRNPSSLSIDLELNRVYWINQAGSGPMEHASIQYYDIMLDKIETILNEHDFPLEKRIYPSVMCVDGNFLLVSGRIPTETIMRISKDDIRQRTTLKTPNLDQLSALRVYNASLQTGSNACSQNNGNCSQLCLPTNSTHRVCKCTMGYSNNPDNETECIGRDLFLIFSYNLGMKGISLEPNSSSDDYYLPPIHKAFRASSIDYIHRDNFIYWVDNEEGSITRINRDTTNYQVIVQGLESEESIGLDWIAGNIYWLDPYYDTIEVAHLNGSNRCVIVSGDMDKANGIVVNPIKGYIVWSDIGTYPKIEMAKLDGSSRRVIVGLNLTHVDDLAIDYTSDYIYWVDSTSSLIERIKDDGTGRQIIHAGIAPNHHLVSIALYKNYLFVADSLQHQGSIIRYDKDNASNRTIIQQQLGDGIRDIAIFAEQPLPAPEENPCVRNNGGCQNLCLFMGERGKRRCLCSHGKLNEDGRTCKPYDTFVLFSKLSQIDTLHIKDDEPINNSPYPSIAIENRHNIISLAVDYEAQRVIYSEISREQICSILFNGTDRRVLVEKQSLVEGVAFENDQLYWTSVHGNSIYRFNTTSLGVPKRTCDSSGCKNAQVEKIIELNAEDKPRGIAIDVCTSYVYWTNWNNNASIQRASPRNGFKIESIIKTNIKVPNGIVIDQKQRKLYWCDAKLDKIETCDMDGNNRIILFFASPQHPFALAVWEGYVFWTDWIARGVFRADKYTGQNPVQIKKVAQRPMGIVVAAPEVLECPTDQCSVNNGGCASDETCFVHHQLSQVGDLVECRPQAENMAKIIPRFNPGSNKYRCTKFSKHGQCEHHQKVMNYHDVLMDVMDRYNVTRSISLESRQITHDNSSEPIISSTESLDSATPILSTHPQTSPTNAIMVHENVTDKSTISSINTTNTTTTKTYMETIISGFNSSVKEQNSEMTTPIYREVASVNSPVNTSQTNLSSDSSASTTRRTQIDMIPQASHPNNVSVPPPTQSPLTNTTSPPCQIVSAALQPTTTDISSFNDCKQPVEFKCYLSDKLVCIASDRRCDGVHDCPSKEDENDCYLSKTGPYNLKRETNWHRFVTVILIILAAAIAALFLVFGTKGRRRWFAGTGGAFNHRRMFDDNGTNIEISNPMFDEDDSGNLVHCAFSIDLNERTTNFSNPLYERQVLLMNEKHVTSN